MKYRFRLATRNDQVKLNLLKNQVHNYHARSRPDYYVPSENSFPVTYYETLLMSDQYRIFVLEYGNEIVAYAITKINVTGTNPLLADQSRLYIEDISVEESKRGKGLGTIFFNYIEEFCKMHGIATITLDVWNFNNDAINFYTRIGMISITQQFEKIIGS